MTAPTPPDPPIQPYAPPPTVSPDAFSQPGADAFGQPGADTFSQPGADTFSQPGADAFSRPGAAYPYPFGPAYGSVPSAYPPPPEQAYPAAPYQYGYSPYGPPARPTDGLAIASLIVSCVSVLALCAYGFGALVGATGAILGHVARRRIRESGAQGDGMALAGIVVGWISTGLGALGIAFLITFIATDAFGSGLN